jgi:hypothetical protein
MEEIEIEDHRDLRVCVSVFYVGESSTRSG